MPLPHGIVLAVLGFTLAGAARAATPAGHPAFLEHVRAEARALRAADRPPASPAAWQEQRRTLRAQLAEAWGAFPAQPSALQPKVLGTLQRDGYRVEKVVFQTLPDVWMTANAYVPNRPGRLPAVLAVHGHWKGAKQDPVVQSRCIGLAKLGFFVLAVDALGAGERGVGKELGEYHGDLTAATLYPVGLTLAGLQVYENMRAVDYLLTRPEVDAARIGITGASGGGNQSMYAGAWDERLAATVPVCSVGNYQAYLGAACCQCEVVPGALRFTEEGNVLALTAPRALLVLSATRDAFQFSVDEARRSLAAARRVFTLQGHPDRVEHVAFDSGHAYNQPMRETMYGWMTRHLKGEGDGAPVPEPAFETEAPETLRCYPGQTRPDGFVTIPMLAAREARRLLAGHELPADALRWRADRTDRQQRLQRVMQGADTPTTPAGSEAQVSVENGTAARTLSYQAAPLIRLTARQEPASARPDRLAVLLDLEGAAAATASPLASALRAAGWSVLTLDLRATGALAVTRARTGLSPDHNPAEWSLWIGRPLLGQWLTDVQATLRALESADGALPRTLAVIGQGPAGLVATAAAALDPRITYVAAVGSLGSYVSAVPYEKQWLGLMVPGIVREAGDIAQIAALIAPRRLVIAGPTSGTGRPLAAEDVNRMFAPTRQGYALERAEAAFTALPDLDANSIVAALGAVGR
ncbi:MAG: acetylxylan esterase [Opitutaceae bacterium]|nr:acetylxylan esterase [Opitutaceae bacterium]